MSYFGGFGELFIIATLLVSSGIAVCYTLKRRRYDARVSSAPPITTPSESIPSRIEEDVQLEITPCDYPSTRKDARGQANNAPSFQGETISPPLLTCVKDVMLVKEKISISAIPIVQYNLVWTGPPCTPTFPYSWVISDSQGIVESGNALRTANDEETVDDDSENVYHKILLNKALENGKEYKVQICVDSPDQLPSLEVNITPNFIDIDESATVTRYCTNTNDLVVVYELSDVPSGTIVPFGYNVALKIGDEEQYCVNQSDVRVFKLEKKILFVLATNAPSLAMANNMQFMLNVIFFSGDKVGSSYIGLYAQKEMAGSTLISRLKSNTSL